MKKVRNIVLLESQIVILIILLTVLGIVSFKEGLVTGLLSVYAIVNVLAITITFINLKRKGLIWNRKKKDEKIKELVNKDK